LHGFIATERDSGDFQEQVAADTGDQQPETYGKGAFRKGCPADTGCVV
jgi:hypothetical protein